MGNCHDVIIAKRVSQRGQEVVRMIGRSGYDGDDSDENRLRSEARIPTPSQAAHGASLCPGRVAESDHVCGGWFLGHGGVGGELRMPSSSLVVGDARGIIREDGVERGGRDDGQGKKYGDTARRYLE